MRQLRAKLGVVDKADGSATFEMGNTKVIAAVYGPHEVQNRGQQLLDQALVKCEYSMANFSTGDRRRKQKGDRRSVEISLVIRQSMEAAILTNLMPRTQIDIFVHVLQADGDNAFGAMPPGGSNPMYGNIGVQPGFECATESYGMPGANMGMAGFSQPDAQNLNMQFDAAFAGGNFKESSKIRKAATFLKTDALQWWTILLNQGVVLSTWVQFKQIFTPTWITITFEVDVMTAWNQLSAIICESLEEYNAKFWDALLPVSSFKMVPLAEQIEKYCCGLPKGIKKYCMKTSVMNMAQLMENAEVADDLIQGKPDEDGFKTCRRKEPQGRQFSAKGNVTSRLTYHHSRKSLLLEKQGFKRHFVGKTLDEIEALRDAKKCYNCEEGHFATNAHKGNSQAKDDKSNR
ncbi:hypothetical protein L7F22_001152 [Adiantum nelumboides]|nr:hypothetical protein [Adiantum nelumboides]